MIHNHEVAGSIPAPATLKINELQKCNSFLFNMSKVALAMDGESGSVS